jgi:hypothetical protein
VGSAFASESRSANYIPVRQRLVHRWHVVCVIVATRRQEALAINTHSLLLRAVSTHRIEGQVNTVSDISSAHFPSLFEALRLLPGIAPRQERDRLGKAKYQAAHSPSHTADFSGMQLTLVQLQELFVYDQQGPPRVSRAGAALLLILFEADAFALVDGRKVKGNTEVLGQYAKGLANVVAFNNRPRVPRKTRSESTSATGARQPSGQGSAIAPARPVQITDVPSVIFRAHIHRLD